MTTNIRERKVTKSKLILGGLVAFGIAVSGYAVGQTQLFTGQPVSAHGGGDNRWGGNDNSQSGALVIDAVEAYLAKNGGDTGAGQVVSLELFGKNARGKLVNGDVTSVFYAHFDKPQDGTEGRWNVVFVGETPATDALVKQNGMPQTWSRENTW